MTPYRADIDGLRGIAILAVVVFHYGLSPFSGGFVGVDLFFVISGFLITSWIVGELDQGGFGFLAFYERRVRRLLPALLVMLAVVLAVGGFALLPSDLIALGGSTLATLGFVANGWFWRNEGYFDLPLTGSPLLHAWSLAVEEQYYLVYPALLAMVAARARQHLGLVLAMLGAASLALCIALQPLAPVAVFYLAPFRGWEFAVGGLLALGAVPPLASRAARETAGALGLSLIAGSFAAIAPGSGFPGWQATVPVLGTALLIHAGTSGGSLATRALAWRPLVAVGLVSYSLYLWHWPTLVLVGALDPDGASSLATRLATLAGAAAIAVLSYALVERPVRARAWLADRRTLFVACALAAAAIAAAAAVVARSDGFPGRFAPAVATLDRARSPEVPYLECMKGGLLDRRTERCRFGAPGAEPSLLLWGDSHALALLPALEPVLVAQGVGAEFVGQSLCPPLAGIVTPYGGACAPGNRMTLASLEHDDRIRLVVLSAAWLAYSADEGEHAYPIEGEDDSAGSAAALTAALPRTVERLTTRGKRVWVIGPTPGAPGDLPWELARRARFGRADPAPVARAGFEAARAPYAAAVAALASTPGFAHTELAEAFCDAAECAYRDDGGLLYRSEFHLSVHGAERARRLLEREFVARGCFGLVGRCGIIAPPPPTETPP